jgi:signal transduction histidine kinase
MDELRREASLRYQEVGPAYESARIVNSALAGIFVFLIGFVLDWRAFVIGLAIMAGTIAVIASRTATGGYSLRRVMILVGLDAFSIALTLYITGMWPALLLTGAAYVIVSSMLLLPRRYVPAILTPAAAVVGLAVAISPQYLPEAPASVTASLFVATLFLGATAVIVGAASGALHEIRAVERKLLATEMRANALKDQFVSMVSHELRTPLTSISGFAETLRDGWRELDESEVEEFLQIISSQSDALRDVVEDILIIPRLEAGRVSLNLAAFDITPLIHRLTPIILPPGGDKESQIGLTGITDVYADPMRVEQIMRNLLENARKYGGDQIAIQGELKDDCYVVAVIDNGEGIPEEFHERIFQPFEQVKITEMSSGVGLGLPIARRLARAQGGDLWFEPAFPHGARFHLRLPLPEGRSERTELPLSA